MTGQQKGSALPSAILLTVVIAAVWAACFWPARALRSDGVLWMSIAAICCLIPGWIVVFLSGLAIFSNELTVMLVQTMVRLMSVSVVAIVVKKTRPELGFAGFYGWLVGFYLLALLTEVWLMSRHRSSSQPSAYTSDADKGHGSE
ncbi:MAG: hypothetical protein P8J37_08025 [Fuerstiella sp.]|nr:hypothetical protein [Fuerstiella sp.]